MNVEGTIPEGLTIRRTDGDREAEEATVSRLLLRERIKIISDRIKVITARNEATAGGGS